MDRWSQLSPWLPGGILAETGRGPTRAGSGADKSGLQKSRWRTFGVGRGERWKIMEISGVKPSKQKLELVGALVLYVDYIIFRCSIPIWDDHPYWLSNKKTWRNHRLSPSGDGSGSCMEILYLGYGHPFASDFCRALQTVPRYRVFTHSHEKHFAGHSWFMTRILFVGSRSYSLL